MSIEDNRVSIEAQEVLSIRNQTGTPFGEVTIDDSILSRVSILQQPPSLLPSLHASNGIAPNQRPIPDQRGTPGQYQFVHG